MSGTKILTMSVPMVGHKNLRILAAEQDMCITALVRNALDMAYPGWREGKAKKAACSDVDASEQAQYSRNS